MRILHRLSHHRRALAAVAAALGVLTLIQALTPSPDPTTPVVVAAREIPGGQELAADDVAVVAMPAGLVPDAAVSDPAAVTGQVLTATTPRGVAITDRALLTPHALDPGRVLAPVRFADADLVQVVRPGDHIDIVAAGPDIGADAVVASDVRVVSLPRGDDDGGVLRSSGSSDGILVLVEATKEQAAALAQITSRAVLTPVLR